MCGSVQPDRSSRLPSIQQRLPRPSWWSCRSARARVPDGLALSLYSCWIILPDLDSHLLRRPSPNIRLSLTSAMCLEAPVSCLCLLITADARIREEEGATWLTGGGESDERASQASASHGRGEDLVQAEAQARQQEAGRPTGRQTIDRPSSSYLLVISTDSVIPLILLFTPHILTTLTTTSHAIMPLDQAKLAKLQALSANNRTGE